MNTDTYKGRPYHALRAVAVVYEDGLKPEIDFLVVDGNAPEGGLRIEYSEIAEAKR